MDALLEIVDVSRYHDLEARGTAAPPAGLRIHCRLRAKQNANICFQSFDFVDVCFNGLVKTEVGTKSSVKPIFEITESRTWQDFEPLPGVKSSLDVSITDITFLAPYRDGILPSTSLAGVMYMTRSASLNDQHLVNGKCEVNYWIEAVFKHNGYTVSTQRLPLNINKFTAPYLLASSPLSSIHCVCRADPSSSTLLWRGWPWKSKSQLAPRIGIELGEQWMTVSRTKHQVVSIPLTLTLHLTALFEGAYPIDHMLRSGIQDCNVEAKWHKQQTFATSGLLGLPNDVSRSLQITQNTESTQSTTIHLPPLYQENDISTKTSGHIQRISKFSASTILELILPDTVSSPSTDMDILRIAYQLELSMSFQQRCTASKSLAWTANMRMPVLVEMA